jgi:hypothetical protein
LHGWNYLNPTSESEITLVNNTKFLFSLGALNFKFDIGVQHGIPQATKRYLRSEQQFFTIEKFLAGDGALVEYVDPEIPTKPLLLRDWNDMQAIQGILAQLPDWVRKLRTDRVKEKAKG